MIVRRGKNKRDLRIFLTFATVERQDDEVIFESRIPSHPNHRYYLPSKHKKKTCDSQHQCNLSTLHHYGIKPKGFTQSETYLIYYS